MATKKGGKAKGGKKAAGKKAGGKKGGKKAAKKGYGKQVNGTRVNINLPQAHRQHLASRGHAQRNGECFIEARRSFLIVDR